MMVTINEAVSCEITIKNSKFICYLYPINSKNDVDSMIDNIKKIHPKATHYCYAYILDNVYHSSDDGEPSGTAGIPILNVLQKRKLNNVLAIVVRYFGGIKLGAGGLIRAYQKAVIDTLNVTECTELLPAFKINIVFSYTDVKKMDYVLRDYNIIDKIFSDDITYICIVDQDTLNKLNAFNVNISVLSNNYIKKLK